MDAEEAFAEAGAAPCEARGGNDRAVGVQRVCSRRQLLFLVGSRGRSGSGGGGIVLSFAVVVGMCGSACVDFCCHADVAALMFEGIEPEATRVWDCSCLLEEATCLCSWFVAS